MEGEKGRRPLARDQIGLAHRFDRLGGAEAIAIPATYTESIATVR